MLRLIILIAVLLALGSLVNTLRNTPPAQRRGLYWKVGLGALALTLIVLAATGRAHWLAAVAGALIPLARALIPWLIRLFPLLHHHYRRQQGSRPMDTGSGGQHSQVDTATLRMVLYHDSNTLTGSVRNGPFAGSGLDQLSLEQLLTLLDYCQSHDNDSVRLLVRYLDHRFGNQWQGKSWQDNSGQDKSRSDNNTQMNEDEALAVLGLARGAGRDDIVAAHRRLMQKAHPDRGGSDYLAAKINLAKDTLLKRAA